MSTSVSERATSLTVLARADPSGPGHTIPSTAPSVADPTPRVSKSPNSTPVEPVPTGIHRSTRVRSHLEAVVNGSSPLTRGATPPVSIEMPLPSAGDIERIIEMYDNNAPIGEIINAINDARPYKFSMASYPVIVGTGMLFSKVAPAAILRSFVSDTSNAVLTDLFERGEVGQITKMRGGNLRVVVTTKDAQMRLRNQVLTILNKEVRVLDQNPLEDLFYLDVFDVHSAFDFDKLLIAFSEVNMPALFSSFREVGRGSVTVGSFRVYFRSKHCPEELMRNGTPCDQILFGNCLHLARGKGVAPSATAIPFGKRSLHLLDLDQALRRKAARTPSASGKRKREAESAKTSLPSPRLEQGVSTGTPPTVLDECNGAPPSHGSSGQESVGFHPHGFYHLF